jgi:F-type H+-transporting ATPase subunit a
VLRALGCFLLMWVSSLAFGGGFDFYRMVAGESGSLFVSLFFVLFLIVIVGLFFRAWLSSQMREEKAAPPTSLFAGLLVTLVSFLNNLSRDLFGERSEQYLKFLSGIFLFVLLSNLSGLVPGFPPPTENFSVNLTLGLFSFLYYNYWGLKEHGVGYVKHFMGPFLVLAPLFFVLEMISHCARPMSLAFRLTANIFGDHLLMGVFSEMVPLGVPALLLFFGLLVACIQSFVFTLLTGIYISMAISHDH